MPILINEMNAINDNMFIYEDRIKSPVARLIDTQQTYTTFFHINNEESTTDAGFIDVASYIGFRSPIRFNKIENFPIYGIDQIVLQLQDDEVGIDSSYEGDAIILPGTIKPVPNDFFIIPTLKDSYLFRITEIQYDTIMPDNYYKVNFKLETIEPEKIQGLEDQTIEEYVCVLENYGTDENCIIEKSCFTKITEINKMYREICEFYTAMFYNERHNVFLGELGNMRYLYDPLQTEFINKHKLFNERNNLQTLILTDQMDDNKRKLKYAKSIYKFVELRDMKLLNNFKFTTRPGVALHESSFYRWHDKFIDVLDIPNILPDNSMKILSDDFVANIQYNAEIDSAYATLLKRYLRKESLSIKDIPLTLSDELVYLNNSLEVFFFTPIIMYIIRDIIKNELKK